MKRLAVRILVSILAVSPIALIGCQKPAPVEERSESGRLSDKFKAGAKKMRDAPQDVGGAATDDAGGAAEEH